MPADDQCGIAFKDVPPFPIKLMDTDKDTEGPRAPEHIQEIQIKEKKERYEKERAEKAEKKRADALFRSRLEERYRREKEELTAAHHKEMQEFKTQTLLKMKELKDTLEKLRGDANFNTHHK